jgi:hypothetical protein
MELGHALDLKGLDSVAGEQDVRGLTPLPPPRTPYNVNCRLCHPRNDKSRPHSVAAACPEHSQGSD